MKETQLRRARRRLRDGTRSTRNEVRSAQNGEAEPQSRMPPRQDGVGAVGARWTARRDGRQARLLAADRLPGDPSTGRDPGDGTGDVDSTGRVEARLGDVDLVVVSNREPYVHEYEDGEVTVDRPVGGLTAALDPIVRDLGGTWVAWGSGDADAATADDDGRIAVPPSSPSYTLRRLPLDDEEVDGYYYGYSNRVLWPVCHDEVGKVDAGPGYWDAYRRVNRRFADAVVEECPPDGAVWFQDYHLALAPRLVRERLGPAASLAQFWHVPWPSAGGFRACPHHRELLAGLLANDLLGFHLDRYCRRFLDSVETTLDATVDRSAGAVSYRGHRTLVRAFPLGTDVDAMAELARSRAAADGWRRLAARHGLGPETRLAVGVDRLDYTKGLVHRLAALETLWETRPRWRGRLTYVQKASESRSRIPEYRRVQERVEAAVDRINRRFGTADWTPVVYLTETVPRATLAGLYRRADLALVTPICDGMNLVAKEFVAASVDRRGVLVLSDGAGASETLGPAAVSVSPRDVAGVADAVEAALEMPAPEERRRMAELRRRAAETDPTEWTAAQLSALGALREDREPADVPAR